MIIYEELIKAAGKILQQFLCHMPLTGRGEVVDLRATRKSSFFGG